MRTVQQIYAEYEIMPSLQLHQLRVASVARVIIENFNGTVNKDAIIFACLFHDMGNIIKSDLNRFPEFLEPEGLEYWKGVKERYIKKYGNEEHLATLLIAKEIGLSPESLFCLDHIGFSNAERNEKEDSFENKICNYSDMRVDPYGVVSMEERISEAQRRYALRKHTISSDKFEPSVASLRNIEKQIFSRTDINPDEITNEKIQDTIKELFDMIYV
jgi:HD domain